MEHTPGPWKAVKAPHGPIDIIDPRGRDVVTVYGGGVESGSQQANACLIAAAPELLEACRLLIGADGEGMMFSGRVNKARHAIAKAEGR